MWCSYITLFDERTGNSFVVMTEFECIFTNFGNLLGGLVEDDNIKWVSHTTTDKDFIKYLETVGKNNVFRIVHRAGQRGRYLKWFFVRIDCKVIGPEPYDDGYTAKDRYSITIRKLNNLDVIERLNA